MRGKLFGKTNNEKLERGSITIFLACILFPMIMAEATIFNLSAQIAAKHAAINAGKLASNSALAAYDHELHDRYGLIAFRNEGVEGIVSQTFTDNLNMSSYGSGSGNSKTAAVSTSYMTSVGLGNDEVLKGQICDTMWRNYKASEKLEEYDIRGMDKYHEELELISYMLSYDEEQFNLYSDLQAILDEAAPYRRPHDEISEEDAEELAETIKELCNTALGRKSTLDMKKREWNDALQNSSFACGSYSIYSALYSAEPDLEDCFESVQNLSFAMDYYTGSEGFYDYVTSGCSYTFETDEEIDIDVFLCGCTYITEINEYATSSSPAYGPGSDGESDESWKSEYNSKLMVNKGAEAIHLTMSYSADRIDENNGYYSEIAPQNLNYEERTGSYSSLGTAVESQMDLLKDTTEVYSVIPECQDALRTRSVDYIISEYATEFFGSYHRTDDHTLTGDTFGTFGAGHTPTYSDVEYIIYGMSSARDNCEQFKSQIFYTQYAAHMIYNISELAPKLFTDSGPVTSSKYLNQYYKDDVEALVSAQDAASDDIKTIYGWESAKLNDYDSSPSYSYAHYMKLFMLMSVMNSEDAVLQRIRYVINTNMGTIESGFSLDTAYTAVTIKAKVNVKGVIGNGTSFDYNTYAAY